VPLPRTPARALGSPVGLMNYFKRFRMEIDLAKRDFSRLADVDGYRLVGWDPALLEIHAETKYLSFRSEIDSNVFPCLGDYSGCLRLMGEISRKPGFLPEATWLIAQSSNGRDVTEYCGTIQGIRDKSGVGAIQNLGIVPDHRGRGLGTLLMLHALRGFQEVGLKRAFLEVTAQNSGAIKLYRRLGFSKARTVYKVVEVAYS